MGNRHPNPKYIEGMMCVKALSEAMNMYANRSYWHFNVLIIVLCGV